jgi:hypothetical protein
MDHQKITPEDKEVVIETHIFTTMKYKHVADNGFSGNLALLCHAIEYSDKVLDEDLKILAKSILPSVIQHKVIKHKNEDIEEACRKKRADDKAKEEAEASKLVETS